MPAFSLGKGQRTKLCTILTPGPGAYQITTISKVPAYSITKDIYAEEDTKNQYHQLQQETAQNAKQLHSKFQTPGPGKYNIHFAPIPKIYKKQISITTKLSRNDDESPGPGQYNPHSRSTLGGKTFGYKQSDTIIEGTVGPAYYEANNSSFHQYIKDKKKSPHIVTRQKNDIEPRYSPGPGYYNLTQTISDITPKITMAPKLKTIVSKLKIPGPGTYDIFDHPSGICHGFGSITTKSQSKLRSKSTIKYSEAPEYIIKKVHTYKMVKPFYTKERAQEIEEVKY